MKSCNGQQPEGLSHLYVWRFFINAGFAHNKGLGWLLEVINSSYICMLALVVV